MDLRLAIACRCLVDLGGIIRERTLQPRFELREVEPDFIRRQELVRCAGKAGDHHKVAFLDAFTGYG